MLRKEYLSLFASPGRVLFIQKCQHRHCILFLRNLPTEVCTYKLARRSKMCFCVGRNCYLRPRICACDDILHEYAGVDQRMHIQSEKKLHQCIRESSSSIIGSETGLFLLDQVCLYYSGSTTTKTTTTMGIR